MIQKTFFRLKKCGKPGEPLPIKYVYTPWADEGPSEAKVAAARRKFQQVKFWRAPHPVMPVKDVPDNMYTYGKEGMSLPIAIFKDQPDPVIGPEWTYPGIYDMKKFCQAKSFEDLVMKRDMLRAQKGADNEEFDDTDDYLDYWEKRQLRARTETLMRIANNRMRKASSFSWFPHTRVKGKKPKSRAETAAQRKAEQAARK